MFGSAEIARLSATAHLKGVQSNLDAYIAEQFIKEASRSMPGSTDYFPYVFLLTLRTILTGRKPALNGRAHEIDDMISILRRKIDREIFTDMIASIHDQTAYAEAALRLLANLDFSKDDLQPSDRNEEGEDNKNDEKSEDRQDTRSGKGRASPLDQNDTGMTGDQKQGMSEASSSGDDHKISENLKDGTQKSATPSNPLQKKKRKEKAREEGNSPGYKIYTTKYDQIIDASKLADEQELQRLRAQLNISLAPYQTLATRLANRLQRALMAQQQAQQLRWDFRQEDGEQLDWGNLAGIITDPTNTLIYKKQLEAEVKETVVTLLIDNSGSMRGHPITMAAMSADILARTLERCGVKTEILGFTTRAWKGGQSREAWINGGRPPSPGRVNDLQHIIYKSADTPWRRAKNNLGLMLRENLLKENIDGEALLWAHQRLLARPESRRILMIISDGAPVDDATLSANPGNYLERHLKNVIEWIETRSAIELTAIGIGHDVTKYYKRAITIPNIDMLGETLMNSLRDLFTENTGKKRGPSGNRRTAPAIKGGQHPRP